MLGLTHGSFIDQGKIDRDTSFKEYIEANSSLSRVVSKIDSARNLRMGEIKKQ